MVKVKRVILNEVTANAASKSLFLNFKKQKKITYNYHKTLRKTYNGVCFCKFINFHYVISVIDEFFHKYISLVFMGHLFRCFYIDCYQNCAKTVVSSLSGRMFS